MQFHTNKQYLGLYLFKDDQIMKTELACSLVRHWTKLILMATFDI